VISGRRGLDPPSNAFFRRMSSSAKPPGVPVGKVLREGDLVSGFRLISTPGHTLGHASLLRDSDGLLFTADAFGCLPRRIRVGVRKALCADPPLAKHSAQKLLAEDFATVVMAHGPVLRADARAKLQRPSSVAGTSQAGRNGGRSWQGGPALDLAQEAVGVGPGADAPLAQRPSRPTSVVRGKNLIPGDRGRVSSPHRWPGSAEPFVILHKDKAIGYIQSYLISDEGYASLVEVEDSAGD
jgi:glyoxylase-like metal-dependent hydrolase (beta-lactamase superfamily II)